jgi:hypothetical protein
MGVGFGYRVYLNALWREDELMENIARPFLLGMLPAEEAKARSQSVSKDAGNTPESWKSLLRIRCVHARKQTVHHGAVNPYPIDRVSLMAKRYKVPAKNGKGPAEAPEVAMQKRVQQFEGAELNRFCWNVSCWIQPAGYHPSRSRTFFWVFASRYRIKVDSITEAVRKEFAAKQKKAQVANRRKQG